MIRQLVIVSLFFVHAIPAFSSSLDEDDVISFDASPFRNSNVFCETNGDVSPRSNEFKLLDYAVMSSKDGRRYALITIENESGGQRIFEHYHLVSTMGDCSRLTPKPIKIIVSSGEVVTFKVDFGVQQYPIVNLSVNQ